MAGGQVTDPESAWQVAANRRTPVSQQGFERTTVRDWRASAVGIQSGSIFHHFKSKDEILRSVMEETIRYKHRPDAGLAGRGDDLRGRAGADSLRAAVDQGRHWRGHGGAGV